MTFRKILIAVAAAVFLFSGFMILKYYWQCDSSEEYIEDVVEIAVNYVEQPTEVLTTYEMNATQMPSHTEEETSEIPEITEVAPIEVDFKALYEINQDVVAWIYSPDTPINYPIVQAEDNAYYLRRRLDGKSDSYGTLFMDYRNTLDDWNCIVHGHNMYSEAMFGTLTKYRKQDYFDAHSVMYLITPQQSYKIRIFAGFTASRNADVYLSLNPEEKSALIEKWMNASDFDSQIYPAITDRIITLSTCAYEYDEARYILMGVMEELAN